MVECNKCQIENLENAKFCRECGEKLDDKIHEAINTIVCLKCDNLNPADTKFCEQCGSKIIFNKETKLKSIIISAVFEWQALHQFVNEAVESVNLGETQKQENKEKFIEIKIKIEAILKLLKGKRKEIEKDKKLKSSMENRIKEIERDINSLEDFIKESEDNSFACPYCKREINVDGGVQDKEMEIECELCHKNFKCITGTVKVIRGKTNARVQYGAEPISITLKLKNREMAVNFKTNFRFLLNRGDKISITYLKKFFSKLYNENPSLIFNWDSEEVYKVGPSLF